MSRDRVLLLMPVTPRMRARLSARFDVIEPGPDGDLPAGAGDAVGVLTGGHIGVPEAVVAACPGLRAVSCYGVGYDAVDVAGLKARGIPVGHTPGVLDDDVANMAVLLLLAASRDLVLEDAHVRGGGWAQGGNRPLAPGIAGKRVGMLGLGRIGMSIARKLETAFGCDIVYHTRTARDVSYRHYGDLVDMARECWAVIAITPGGPATHHLVDQQVMEALGPDGILVNVARGSVVDQEALIACLSDGRLGRAALDVFADEPHVPQALAALGNVIMTPHIASATVETRQAMGDLAVDNLIAFFDEGRMRAPVPECAAM